MEIVYAIMIWLMPSGLITGAFEEIPEGYDECQTYINGIVELAADSGKSMVGRCTYDLDELIRFAQNHGLELPDDSTIRE